ncbi:MAG: twin-arginine translocase TatA/TatE family subunit [Anaerolineales bacterium]
MPFAIQPIHIVIVILVAFLIFGASRLPEMGRSLGKGISEFRKETKEAAEGFKEEVNKPINAPAPAAPDTFPAPNQAVSPATVSSEKPTGNFCTHCGTPIPPEARFCASCGAKLPEKLF